VANSSLTAVPCSHNDGIAHLSGLIEISHVYYATQNDCGLVEFVSLLRTIIGLGFTACLVAGYDAMNYQTYFLRFIHHRYGNPEASMTLPQLADSVSRMVELALGSFCALGYPDYYKSFIQAIAKVIDNPQVKASTKSEHARQLLELLNRENYDG
jgi:hypothetical protein